jgi:pyruvate/2-oxoglutarate/acetoin dehydrogenase E1 component
MEMSYAQAGAAALAAAMRDDPRIVALGEDLGRGGIFGQYKGLLAEFGAERVIDTPISEATIVGAGVGMALAGCKPVVELRVADFALCAMDEIVNQAAKNRFMFGGQGRVPLVMRLPIGVWSASAAQHSQSLEAWFAHLPGVVVLTPSTPQDNFSMLRAALQADDPVVYMEHKELWGMRGDVNVEHGHTLGRAQVRRQGSQLTIVTWSACVHTVLQAADALHRAGVDASVIDLGSLWPWDRDTVFADCACTQRLLVVHEAVQVGGFGAPRVPVGYAATLEAQARISVDAVVRAALELL